jgi:hypothetical protein
MSWQKGKELTKAKAFKQKNPPVHVAGQVGSKFLLLGHKVKGKEKTECSNALVLSF